MHPSSAAVCGCLEVARSGRERPSLQARSPPCKDTPLPKGLCAVHTNANPRPAPVGCRCQVMPADPCPGVEHWSNPNAGSVKTIKCPGEDIWSAANAVIRDSGLWDVDLWGMAINPVNRRGQHQVLGLTGCGVEGAARTQGAVPTTCTTVHPRHAQCVEAVVLPALCIRSCTHPDLQHPCVCAAAVLQMHIHLAPVRTGQRGGEGLGARRAGDATVGCTVQEACQY